MSSEQVILNKVKSKFYPVTNYIKCINKLKQPYPEEALLNFIKGYENNFTRETDPSLIYFDGKNVVIEKRRDPVIMKDDEIESMLYDLLKYHDKNTCFYQKYVEAVDILKNKRGGVSRLWTRLAGVPKEKFTRYVIRQPTLDIFNRWEIGILGKNNLIKDAEEFVSGDFIDNFPEIYMVKILKQEAENLPCSRAEIYLETEELNIQNILDRLHKRLRSSKVKLNPLSCHKKPKFMSTIGILTQNTKEECIFCFSQGGEDIYEYKEHVKNPLELEIYFDGNSHYKFFGTLDVSIDIKQYLVMTDMIEQIADIMRKMGDYDPESVELLYKTGDIGTTEGVFTKLLYTDNIPIKMFRNILQQNQLYIDRTFLHGIDSHHPIFFIMKPDFEKKYMNKAIVNSVIANDKINQSREAYTLSFRYPKPSGEEKCKGSKKPSWCNSRLVLDDTISFYDIDVVLAPHYMKGELQKYNEMKTVKEDIPNPFMSRIVFYGKDIPKEDFLIRGDEAYKRSLAPLPDTKYYLSYECFVDVQKEYMLRLAYYGFFTQSKHTFL